MLLRILLPILREILLQILVGIELFGIKRVNGHDGFIIIAFIFKS
jgi:hypothetical protein